MGWVLNDAPTDNQGEMLVLLGMANHASKYGRGVWCSQKTLAEYARCTDRTVRTHLAALEQRGIIRRGDQSMVEKFPPQRRPIVWDLAMELRRESRPENISGLDPADRKPGVVRPEDSGELDRKAVSYKPSLEPSRTVLSPETSALVGSLPTLASLRSAPLCTHEAIAGRCAICRNGEAHPVEPARTRAPRCEHGEPIHRHPECFAIAS